MPDATLAPVTGRNYDIVYEDLAGNRWRIRGRLLSPDELGFVVVEVGSNTVLLPKSRIEIMAEDISVVRTAEAWNR